MRGTQETVPVCIRDKRQTPKTQAKTTQLPARSIQDETDSAAGLHCSRDAKLPALLLLRGVGRGKWSVTMMMMIALELPTFPYRRWVFILFVCLRHSPFYTS